MEAVLKLDQHLQSSLRRWPLPEPVLILTHSTITLFGQSRPLARFPSAEMACLWVLPEHAGEDMKRETIIEEGGLNTDFEYLTPVVSRLNKSLLELAGTAPVSSAGDNGRSSEDPRFVVG